MHLARLLLAVAATIALTVSPVLAHSLKHLEGQLMSREPYFQPVDVEAPGFTLEDASGRRVSLSDLRGKVVVLNFIYTTCTDVCPLHSQLIAQLQSLINISSMKRGVAFISITTDPGQDRGAVLSDYGEAHGLDPVNWTFLTSLAGAAEDSTRVLAKAYGLEFTATPDGEQMHGIVTHVIDREGHLRGRFHGMCFGTTNFVVFVSALVNDVHKGRETEKDEERQSFWSWLTSLFTPMFGGGA